MHRHSAVCLYADETAANGWLVGFVTVTAAHGDVMSLVFFALLFAGVLPAVAACAGLAHIRKSFLCRRRVRYLLLEEQRLQLVREVEQRRQPPPAFPGLAVANSRPTPRASAMPLLVAPPSSSSVS